jgi:hypothetical protein
VAFVNKQGGAEKHETRAGAGLEIEFDPEDPDVVKVHYDLSAWTFDQRAELSEALAQAELPHAWDGDELLVPESVEAATDAMFDKLETELGPFPIGLDDDAESTEFGLDEWTEADRQLLTESLIESEIPYRWDGTTVIVAHDAEDAVDDLLDAIESGELMSADPDAADSHAPDGALSDIFLAADKLAKDPFDAKSRKALIDMNDQLDARHPPYALAPRPWKQIVAGVGTIVDRIVADADGDRVTDDDADGRLEESSDVIGLAQVLRELVRPFV